MEHDFFESEYDQAGTRFETYSIADQIKIYLYGMQTVVPPAPVLSRPIAEHGQAAIPMIMGVLKSNPTDQNIKDLMVIFETMQRIGSYDVQHDKSLVKKLDTYINDMKDGILRGYSKDKLNQIKRSNGE